MNDEKYLYEYAVIRVVPRVEREEFFNVGLIMMCKRRRWIRVETLLRPCCAALCTPDVTEERISAQLRQFAAIALGQRAAGPIAELPPEERFRWLTAVRSTWLQTSRPHPGLTPDLDATFDSIFNEQVR